jgi:hypothetical protein
VDASEADFFYFSFLGNVLETSKKLVYMGERVMNKTNSFHILGQDISGTTFQFWIDMNSYLPVKVSYAYLGQEQQPRYQASYSDWIINSPMSDSIFYYIPPAPSDVDD